MTTQVNRLMQARCRLMTLIPFYGHIAMTMKWMESSRIKTMGVRISSHGYVECLYNPSFVESMSLKELYAVIQHEIEHIVRCHCIRVGSRMPEPWNIAADCCVNGTRNSPRIGYVEHDVKETILPFKGDLCWIQSNWPQDGTTEHFYDLLVKNAAGSCPKCGKCPKPEKSGGSNGKDKQKKGSGDSGSGSGSSDSNHDKVCPVCGSEGEEYSYGGVSGKMIDDHSVWNESDVSREEARQIVKDIVEQAVSKAAGHIPGHLTEIIKELSTPVVRWREILRHYLGKHVGNKRNTYSRCNRRYNFFGVPGVSHHAAATVNVIIDTSGSVCTKQLEQFFTEIESIAYRAKISLLQWDHGFQGFCRYRKNDWKKISVNGRGGTDMVAPIDWLMDNKLIADVQIMLTDGYVSDWHKPEDFPLITVITSKDSSAPAWGNVVRLDMFQ